MNRRMPAPAVRKVRMGLASAFAKGASMVEEVWRVATVRLVPHV